MPERGDQERTERATPKRRQEARKRGHVAKSREVPMAAILLGGLIFLTLQGRAMGHALMDIYRELLWRSGRMELTVGELQVLMGDLGEELLSSFAPMNLFIMAVGVMANVLQTGFVFAEEALAPRFSRINPIDGFRRLFSLRAAVEALKAFLKLAIVAYAAWKVIGSEWTNVVKLVDTRPPQIVSYVSSIALKLGYTTGFILLALAFLDYLYQRWEYERDLRMTKEEVKEEMKQREGDPLVKSRVRRVQREMTRARMMAAVPKADVVITNPEHLAVALLYERDRMEAPEVVAKGMGFIAERIKEIARTHGIPIVEDRPLAQALYRSVKVGAQIPVNLYRAVAEILAYVYKQKGIAFND